MLITPNRFEKINQEFLENLIKSGIEENINLDYKRQLDNNSEIAKDLSAFANSEGGNIIYGIDEEKNKPKRINPLVDTNIREKIDNISQNGINPPLNVRIKPIDVNIEGVQGQIFVIYIPRKYPFLHYANTKQRYYKRSNVIIVPMEHYEIEKAFRSQIELRENLENIIKSAEDEFLKQIGGYNLQIILVINPSVYGKNLFEINDDITQQLLSLINKTPKFKNPLFIKSKNAFRQEDYFFKSAKYQHLADCLIRKDGIIMYEMHFELITQPQITHFKRDHKISFDYELYEIGVIPEKRIFNTELIFDYFLAFLKFIYQFYTKFNYYEDIDLELKIKGLAHFEESLTGKVFKQNRFKPEKKHYNVELISSKRLNIARELFTPIFNAFGILDKELESFYSKIEDTLKENLK